MENRIEIPLFRKQHISYFKRFLYVLPESFASFDSSRLTLAFFALSGLDILNGLQDLDDKFKLSIIEWIYRLQVVPTEDASSKDKCGFEGSDALHIKDETCQTVCYCNPQYAMGHIAMTYTGLASLILLGDDLSRVNRQAVVSGLTNLQQEDGSFCAMNFGSENDVRFVYCAACICYMLNDWSGINIPKTINYIKRCLNYDFGFGQNPGVESHGGVTYCALAALSLMEAVDSTFTKYELERIQRWLLMRQESGFQGRPNKPVDTCYSFWVGGAIKILGMFDMVDAVENRRYIMITQDSITGGFSKWANITPDPLHTYLGLGALSLMKEEGLGEIDPALNMSKRALGHLLSLHKSWTENTNS